ncbi:MAG: lasso peptide biosynthesis B2 protein [Nocardiopsaceae bacterium]|nr:lasso peptide biosynthesis B2 protein [Nocardiopsaceae bacterium]
MTRSSTVAVLTEHACVLVDYRTGRTELRPSLPDDRGRLLVVQHESAGVSWGTGEMNAALTRPSEAGIGWRLASLPAMAMTVTALVCGPRRRRFARMVWLACIGRRLTPAEDARTHAAVNAVRRMSALLPARWACLEQSVAVAVLLALVGRRAEWRHGVATDPVRLHAWITDSSGRPVGEDPTISFYTPIYTTDGPALPGKNLENGIE